MEQAFAAGKVDETIHGNWDEIQVQLGLKSREAVPREVVDPRLLQYFESLERKPSARSGFGVSKIQQSSSNRKTKQKSNSRHKNRKKK
jgi:hypothetical protein